MVRGWHGICSDIIKGEVIAAGRGEIGVRNADSMKEYLTLYKALIENRLQGDNDKARRKALQKAILFACDSSSNHVGMDAAITKMFFEILIR